MAVRKFIDLTYNSFVDFLIAMTQARHCRTSSGVKDFLAILEEDVAAFAADGLFGNEAGISVEDGTGC